MLYTMARVTSRTTDMERAQAEDAIRKREALIERLLAKKRELEQEIDARVADYRAQIETWQGVLNMYLAGAVIEDEPVEPL